MEKFAVVLVALAILHTSQALDYCKASYTTAECKTSCAEGDISHPYPTFLCVTGTCCESTAEEPDTPQSTQSPVESTTPIDENTCGVKGNLVYKRSIRTVSDACTWPWLVSIRMSNTDLNIATSHILTGILVSKTKVLVHNSTFEAFNSIPGMTVEAAVGEYYLNMEGDERHTYVINMTKTVDEGDFKLLELDVEVAVNDCVRPVCLTSNTDELQTDHGQCRLVGWGTTESGTDGLTLVPVPLQSDVNIDDPAICSRLVDITGGTYSDTDLCLDMTDGTVITEGERGNAVICPDDRDRWHLKGILTQASINTGFGSLGPFAIDVTTFADQIAGRLN